MKGIMKTLEAVIAILMVLVVYVIIFSATVLPPDFTTINDQLTAFTSLKVLDQSNQLRKYVLENDTTTIANELSSLMPSGLSYQVAICTTVCAAPAINSTNIFSVGYIVSGDLGSFAPRQVIVYMWS